MNSKKRYPKYLNKAKKDRIVRKKNGEIKILTNMQMACFNFLKDNDGFNSVEKISETLYCPLSKSVWGKEERENNIKKWCNFLLYAGLAEEENDEYSILK